MSSLSKSFSDVLTFTATGNRTMVDSDGVLKWAPHNLLTYSEDYTSGKARQNIDLTSGVADPFGGTSAYNLQATNVSGCFIRNSSAISVEPETSYTVAVFSQNVSGSPKLAAYDVSNASLIGTKTLTNTGSSWSIEEYKFTTPAGCSEIYVYALTDPDSVGDSYDSFGWHFYRSDLGGMVNNPDRGDSYVPTTSSAVFLPRRGHHVWDGSQWVNKGLLLESESRTNLVKDSQDFTTVNWSNIGGVGVTGASETVNGLPFNEITGTGVNAFDRLEQNITLSASQTYTYSQFIKAGSSSQSRHGVFDATYSWQGYVDVAWNSGVPSTNSSSGASNVEYEKFGEGVYRISFTFIANATLSTTTYHIHPDRNGGTGTILVTGAQLEEGSTPSSYIPTSGSTVTRAGETLTAPSDNLPWPEPVVIGDELVTNGTFDTDTDWTKSNVNITITGGVLDFSSVPTGQNAAQGLSLVVGKVYQVKFDVLNRIEGGVRVEGINSFVPSAGGVTANGSYEYTVVAAESGSGFKIRAVGTTTLKVDNISVREINPLAVSIAMEGGETFADLDTAGQVALYDRRVDANNRITLTLDTDGAKTGTFTLTLVNGGSSETISTTGEIAPDVNEPFNVAFVATSNELGIALNGTAETRVSHSLGLPDLSTVDATYEGMGTRAVVREWADDITNAGKEVATS